MILCFFVHGQCNSNGFSSHSAATSQPLTLDTVLGLMAKGTSSSNGKNQMGKEVRETFLRQLLGKFLGRNYKGLFEGSQIHMATEAS